MNVSSSKEKIRNRLIKNAIQLWGVQSSDISAMDPVVNMLFGACATELEKIYNELDSSHARVLERLSKLLLPEVNNGTYPAHGVIHGRSYEPVSVLSKNAQMFYRKRVPSRESSVRDSYQDIYFTPLFDTKIYDGDIKYAAFSGGLFELSEVIHREKIAEFGNNGYRVERSSLWLGIDISNKLETLEGLRLYFDWPTSTEKETFIKFLPFSKLSVGKYEIDYAHGFGLNAQDESVADKIDFDYARTTEKEIMEFYGNRFITIKTLRSFEGEIRKLKTKYPEEFKLYMQPRQLEKLEEELLWVKIVFPSYINEQVLDEMICSINAFPACNKKFNDFSYRLLPNFNIIPLNSDNDFYYNIQSVKAGDGTGYSSNKLTDINRINPGSYVVRKGGAERFDRRNATQFLHYLIELLHDEGAAFKVYGQEMISDNLRELNQQLNILNQKVEKNPEGGEPVTYLILKPKEASDNVFIEYWTTTGSFANSIRINSELHIGSANDLNNDNLMFLSNVTGGRDSMSSSETLNAFKYSLMTRDRVVTIADIRNMCYKELGNTIKNIEIKKGLEVDDKSYSGFIRTIDVLLVPTDETTPSREEWQTLCRALQIKIQSHCSFYMPVRVKVK